MKNKVIRSVFAFALIFAFALAALPFSAAAYGTSDNRLVITHINIANTYEGSAVIMAGGKNVTVGSYGGYNWWKVVVFAWDDDEDVYKVASMHLNANNSDKSGVSIPEKGFAYGVCVGNDYSSTGGINYINSRTQDSYALLDTKNIEVGDKAYLYGTDLANGIIKNNGKTWYADDFVSESFIQMFEPVEGMQAYDPDKVTLLGYTITPNLIDKVVYATGSSIIFTPNYGTYGHYNQQASFQWWGAAVFDYDVDEKCYVVKSVDTAVGNSVPKQPIIPKNGFALVDCGANTTALSNLKVGSKCWLYDIDLAKGKLGSNPHIAVNLPESGTAYDPKLTSRPAAPVIKEVQDGRITSSPAGIKLSWNAVSGAESYTISVNESSSCADGPLVLKPTVVKGTEYTIQKGVIEVGYHYTVRVVANGKNADSTFDNHTIIGVNDMALKTTLKDKTIVAFGDSLTARTGYVAMLSGYLGTDVINSGVGGDTSVMGRSRFQTDVLDKDPDIVIICFGMNDQACLISKKQPNVSLATYRANLEYFAKTLTEKGADVVFVTPNPVCTASGYYVSGSYGLDYGYGFMKDFCNAMREVAFEYGCGLVDINYECEKNEDLTKFINAGDGIHQSVYGHSRYAELISDYLYAAYDGVDKATMTVKCVCGSDTLAEKEIVGKTGADIIIATPELEGYLAVGSDIPTSFKDGEVITFNYAANDGDFAIGDVTGDGRIDAVDYVMAKRSVLKTYTLTEPQFARADVNSDGNVDAIDYAMIKRHVLGTYTIK